MTGKRESHQTYWSMKNWTIRLSSKKFNFEKSQKSIKIRTQVVEFRMIKIRKMSIFHILRFQSLKRANFSDFQIFSIFSRGNVSQSKINYQVRAPNQRVESIWLIAEKKLKKYWKRQKRWKLAKIWTRKLKTREKCRRFCWRGDKWFPGFCEGSKLFPNDFFYFLKVTKTYRFQPFWPIWQ